MSIGTKLAVFLYLSQIWSGAGHHQKFRKSIGILETFGGKAMWQRNNGQAEDDLQFRFTAYLVSAVKRRRKDYLIQLYKRNSIESAVEAVYESEPSSEEVVLDRLPLMDVIENGVLLEALQKLNERERQICKDCKFMVSQSDESTVAIYGLLLQPNFKTREGKCRLREGWCKVDKLWLIRNKLHSFVDYMFFMIRNGQNQKFTHFAHILSHMLFLRHFTPKSSAVPPQFPC